MGEEDRAALQGVPSETPSARTKTKGHRPTSTLWEVLLADLWRGPLHAHSRTRDRLGHIDFAMVVPPTRALLYCMLCPYLSYAISLSSLYGFYRCLRSMVPPKYYHHDRYSKRVVYGAQKRVYDPRYKRICEIQIEDVEEIRHALQVVGEMRNQFIDDPERPGTAYLVIQQRIMRAEALFSGENWAWAFVSDSFRYLTPVCLAYLFHPSCRRLTVDLRLWFQGRLWWRQIRHPILNFFKSYSEYNRAMSRINITKPLPKGSQPWSKNL
ncbi:unnamed protein product [Phytomonas sp. Hart1]|nr:unnamed protein product [Phytomonas sp. Hart1]|eukprot:CCW70090.1 unnamed protein product [Phytomonas sp. isolate Hart1]